MATIYITIFSGIFPIEIWLCSHKYVNVNIALTKKTNTIVFVFGVISLKTVHRSYYRSLKALNINFNCA